VRFLAEQSDHQTLDWVPWMCGNNHPVTQCAASPVLQDGEDVK